MRDSAGWAWRSFLICFILNGVLIAFFFFSENIFAGTPNRIPAVLTAGILLTLIMWRILLSRGRRTAEPVSAEAAPPPLSEVPPAPEAALQILSALQREGRLIDFLQEDLSAYEDGQIGAAVRNIHSGCREALKEYMDVQPIFKEKEGTTVTVPPGFDARAIRLTGNVSGNPPFRGIVRHRGWQAERIRTQGPEEKKNWILAPAEVEIG